MTNLQTVLRFLQPLDGREIGEFRVPYPPCRSEQRVPVPEVQWKRAQQMLGGLVLAPSLQRTGCHGQVLPVPGEERNQGFPV